MKLRSFIAAFVAALVALTVSAAPAMADDETWTDHEAHCHDWLTVDGWNVNACIEVYWRTQDDGSGVKLEKGTYDIYQGCLHLTSIADNGWRPVQQEYFTYYDYNEPDGRGITDGFGIGSGDCHQTFDLERRGPDTGPMEVGWDATVWDTYKVDSSGAGSGHHHHDSYKFSICKNSSC